MSASAGNCGGASKQPAVDLTMSPHAQALCNFTYVVILYEQRDAAMGFTWTKGRNSVQQMDDTSFSVGRMSAILYEYAAEKQNKLLYSTVVA
jgi:hypothetical protein